MTRRSKFEPAASTGSSKFLPFALTTHTPSGPLLSVMEKMKEEHLWRLHKPHCTRGRFTSRVEGEELVSE